MEREEIGVCYWVVARAAWKEEAWADYGSLSDTLTALGECQKLRLRGYCDIPRFVIYSTYLRRPGL